MLNPAAPNPETYQMVIKRKEDQQQKIGGGGRGGSNQNLTPLFFFKQLSFALYLNLTGLKLVNKKTSGTLSGQNSFKDEHCAFKT